MNVHPYDTVCHDATRHDNNTMRSNIIVWRIAKNALSIPQSSILATLAKA
jgi:hypothetical protein